MKCVRIWFMRDAAEGAAVINVTVAVTVAVAVPAVGYRGLRCLYVSVGAGVDVGAVATSCSQSIL